MKFTDNTLIKQEGVFYPTVLRETKSNASNSLQPFWEAFTNALEAISDNPNKLDAGKINIQLYYSGQLIGEGRKFEKLVIKDTGIGFNDEEFTRLLTWRDDRKGHNNRGSGRLQLMHAFSICQFESNYQIGDQYFERKFHISNRANYLAENAIAFLEYTKQTTSKESGTRLIMFGIKNSKVETALNIDINNLKDQIINHYIQYFCVHRDSLPEIVIESYQNDHILEEANILPADIPQMDSTKIIELPYQKYDPLKKDFIKTTQKEKFTIKAFKIPAYQLKRNSIKLTSKDEIIENEEHSIPINVITPDDMIDNSRFLFLVSSPFINNRDHDIRGQLRIYKRDAYMKNASEFDDEEIFLDDIEVASNEAIVSMYNEIREKTEDRKTRIQELKSMFLLNDNFLNKIPFSINDTEERVLEKVYILESKQMAKGDAKIKMQVDKLNHLDPTSLDYSTKLTSIVDALVKEIPHQNRAALTHYVAKRKLVLDIYQKVLERKLSTQNNSKRNHDEKLLHNILFKQGSSNVGTSDLWIISEDFIYFKGTSEARLMDISVNGVKLFKEQLSQEEHCFVNALNLNKTKRRPDVLLFPEEGKCIILEFKAPKVNVAEHLTEINNYASLILNLCSSEFKIDTFFGYLIGEAIDPDEVRSCDSDFKHSYQFDFLIRPAKSVFAKFKPKDGSLYTEVIKYSTLCQRAKSRNDVFIKKLFEGIKMSETES